jgi:hypothetical protein
MPNQKNPKLIKLYIKSCAIGFVLSAIFVAVMLGFDVMGLGGLVVRSDVGFVAVLMMWILNGVVFAGVQFAYVIMSMADDDDDDDDEPRGGLRARAPVFLAEPIPIRVEDARRRR